MTQLEQSVTTPNKPVVLTKDLRDFGTNYGALIALVILIIFDTFFTKQFSSLSAISNTLILVAPVLIISVGMTLVISTGGIDISVGSVMAIAGVMSYLIFSGRLFGIHDIVFGTLISIPIALGAAALVGTFNGVMVTRYGIQPIVATLIMLIGGRGIAEVLINGEQHAFLSAPIVSWLNAKLLGVLPVSVFLALVVVLVAAWVMSRTAYSRYLLAAGGNASASRLAGVPVNRVLIIAYAASGLLAGIAGLVVMAYTSAENPVSLGLGNELDAIAAVAVGGTPLTGGRANIFGTVIGAVFIRLIHQTVISLNVPDDVSRILIGAIILLAVYLQRQRKA